MKIFGYEIGRKPEKVVTEATETMTISKRSYESPLGNTFNGTISTDVDLELYDAIINGIPFLDVAIRKISRMVSPFVVESDNESTEEEVNRWLKTVKCNYLNNGFIGFSRRHVRQALLYGKSAAEITLSPSKKDISGLFNVPTKKIEIIPEYNENNLVNLLLGEKNAEGTTVVYPRQDLFIYTNLNGEGDNPHGVSILRSIPWVSDIALRMENALRQKWQRHGAPSFMVQYKADPQAVVSDETFVAIKDNMKSEWISSMRSRWNEEGIIDFFAASQGEVVVTSIQDEYEMEFVAPFKALMEQIISSVELAPFLLGISWSTTERMSQQQADAIIGMIDDIRSELEPDYLKIIEMYCRLRGLKGKIKIKWGDVDLQDKVETARAELFQAQAMRVKQDNISWLWSNGGISQIDAFNELGYDLAVPYKALDGPVPDLKLGTGPDNGNNRNNLQGGE